MSLDLVDLQILRQEWIQEQDYDGDDHSYYVYCRKMLQASNKDAKFNEMSKLLSTWWDSEGGNLYHDDIEYIYEAVSQAHKRMSCKNCDGVVSQYNLTQTCFKCNRGGVSLAPEKKQIQLIPRSETPQKINTKRKRSSGEQMTARAAPIPKKQKPMVPLWKKSSEARRLFRQRSGLQDNKLGDIQYEPGKLALRCESYFDPDFAEKKNIRQNICRKVFHGTLEQFQHNITYQSLSWHEMFLKGQPTRIFVDLDDFSSGIDLSDMIDCFETHFRDFFLKEFKIQLEKRQWLWMESVKYKYDTGHVLKNSLHGILSAYFVTDICQQAVLFNAFLGYLKGLAKLNVCKACYKAELCNGKVLDLQPYCSNKSLRILKSGKLKELTRTVNRVTGYFAANNFCDSFITYIPDYCKALDKSNAAWFLQRQTQKRKHSIRPQLGLNNATANFKHAMNDYVRRHLQRSEHDYTITSIKPAPDNPNIAVVHTDIRFCNQKKAEHQNAEKLYYIVNVQNWTMTQKCHSSGCGDKKCRSFAVQPPNFKLLKNHKDLEDLLQKSVDVFQDYYLTQEKNNIPWFMERLVPLLNDFLVQSTKQGKNVIVEKGLKLHLDWDEKEYVREVFKLEANFKSDYQHLTLTKYVQRNKKFIKKTVPITHLWLKHRRHKTVTEIAFFPRMSNTNNKLYNMFHGFDIPLSVAKDYKYTQEEIAPFINHIKHVWCRDDENSFNYVMAWFANIYQRPWVKLPSCLVLSGPQGTGKGCVLQKIANVLGHRYFWHIMDLKKGVTGNFSSPDMFTAILGFADESFFGGDPEQANKIKTLISEKTFLLNMKFKDPVQIKNFMNMVLASNNDQICAAYAKERRYYILKLLEKYNAWTPETKKYFNDFFGVPDIAIAAYLADFDTNGIEMDCRSMPTTEGLREQNRENFTAIQHWWFECICENRISVELEEFDSYNNKEKRMCHFDLTNDGLILAKRVVYDAYLQYFKQHPKRYQKLTFQKFKQKFRTFKAAQSTRQQINKRRRPSFEFNSLSICRNNFAKYVGWDKWYNDNE